MNKEEYSKKLIDDVVATILKEGGTELLSSIILTGSFGREEPTWNVDENGEATLKSDVEIALVRNPSASASDVDALMNRVKKAYKEDLNPMAFSESRIKNASNFNYTFIKSRYKTLFTYDLFNGSKTIWGRDYIGSAKINLDDVDPYEAKRIVANRIGELVYLTQDDKDEYLRKQWKGKLMLAIGTAWLVLNKKYSSCYHTQCDTLLNDSTVANDLGEGFIEDYKKVFYFLRESEEEYEVVDKALREYVWKIDSLFKLNKIGKPKVNNLMRVVKYSLKYYRTGCRFGIFSFENSILSSLISQYVQGENNKLQYTALVWHNCIY